MQRDGARCDAEVCSVPRLAPTLAFAETRPKGRQAEFFSELQYHARAELLPVQ